MKLLLIHSDYIEYECTKEALKDGFEEITDDQRSARLEEALTVFTSVESCDEKVQAEVIGEAVKQIQEVAKQVNTDRVMLYPYAHLSSELAAPKQARKISIALGEALVKSGLEVKRSPFGWYKAFKLSCKGHPLSELAREIRFEPGAEKKDEEAITREDVVKDIDSEYIVLTPEGGELRLDLEYLDDYDELNKYPSLKSFIEVEELHRQTSGAPPSIKAMQRLELVDYEEVSDAGHFKLYPKGKLMFKLLEEWSGMIAQQLNAIEIDTPIMYDWSYPDIREQVISFHSRHYTILLPDEKREFVLRFAGDFGLFRMMKNAILSYKQLPVKIYEFSKSFRLEQRGELSGLRRLRAFHMPDIHAFAKDMADGWEEFAEIYKKYIDFNHGTDVENVLAFRIVKDFYEDSKDKIIELLKYAGQPAFIELLSEKKHYWVIKYESHALDSVGGNCQLNTVQLDVEDAERYGIVYTDSDGSQKGCIICHCSIGSIERWIYSLLENALKAEKPELPFWLAPTQVRLIPVREEFIDDCSAIADALPGRVDIDDRDEKVGRKIRDAEREWISMIIVFGGKEKESAKLPVRTRTGDIKEMELDSLKHDILERLKDFPFLTLSVPRLLSKRIIFRG